MISKFKLIVIVLLISFSQIYTIIHKISELPLDNFTSWIEIYNDLAIIGTEETSIFITDISDPYHPEIISELYGFYNVRNIAIKDSVAFVTNIYGLALVDFSDLNNIQTTEYYTENDANFVTIKDDIAIFLYDGHFEIVDITDPLSPQLITNIITEFDGMQARIYQDSLIVLSHNGFVIFDISDISDPTILCEYADSFMDEISFDKYGDEIYISDWNGLHKVDISDLSNPTHLDLNTKFIPNHLSFHNGLLHLVDFMYSYAVFDISDFDTPILRNSYVTPREAGHYQIVDDILYLLDWSYGLQIITLNEDDNPYMINHFFNEFSYVEGVGFNEDYIFIADLVNGLGIYERNNPSMPIYSPDGDPTNSLTQRDNTIFLSYNWYDSEWHNGIKIYDVSYPDFPQLINDFEINCGGIHIIENYLIIDNLFDIDFYDISDLSNPVFINDIDFDDAIYNIAINNDILYVNIQDTNINEIQIFNISDFNDPEYLGSLSLGAVEISEVYVFGDILYAGYYNLSWYGSSSGFYIVDCSDPYSPFIANHLVIHSEIRNRYYTYGYASLKCGLKNDVLVIADNRSNRLITYDAQDIVNPIEINEFMWNFKTNSISFDRNNLILSNWVNGVSELNWDQFVTSQDNIINKPKSLLNIYPNPFNPKTSISFDLEDDSHATLRLYNIKGQLICELLDSYCSKGFHQIDWDAFELGKANSSGVYFISLSVNNEIKSTKRCLLLK